jgi:hypothetical protein
VSSHPFQEFTHQGTGFWRRVFALKDAAFVQMAQEDGNMPAAISRRARTPTARPVPFERGHSPFINRLELNASSSIQIPK